ncbi:TetR/AcrR family transcriptional regulator [Ktedonospora formicarum]|nr:TetR/AcrR family transcriptional regulator [Ktedonospora formicarum]
MEKTFGKRTRVTAQQRREDILAAAITEFSEKGLYGASTVTIAERADISHPNLFRLFPTKKELFIASIERVLERIKRKMIATGKNHPEAPLQAMAESWNQLLVQREELLILLQGYAACHDPQIRQVIRRASIEIFLQIENLPTVTTERAHFFYAEGMFRMLAAAMDLAELAVEDEAARRLLGY